MAQYTVTVNSLLQNEEVKAEIDKALSTYPIYEKKSKEEFKPSIIPTREEINTKLLNRYKYREIGFETVGRWLDELEIAMCEVMPYYNDLMFSADQDYNIIYNVDYQRTTTTDRTGESSSEANSTDNIDTESSSSKTQTTEREGRELKQLLNNQNSKSVETTTPQTALTIGTDEIHELNYADNAKFDSAKSNVTDDNTITDSVTDTTIENSTGKTTGVNTSSASGNNKENEQVLETTKGNFGVVSSQDLVLKYRETIVNIVEEIITHKRIQELFMLVY